MTTKEQIEFIRQKCIEANPEIMELKFGCRLKDKVDGEEYLFVDWHFNTCPTVLPVEAIGKNPFEDECAWQDTIFSMGSVTNEKIKHPLGNNESTYEIIGRPIRLADVLILLQDSKNLKWREVGIGDPRLLTPILLTSYWDLFKDDLTLQSPETIEFIFNLLKS